jgi:hypothetical protein
VADAIEKTAEDCLRGQLNVLDKQDSSNGINERTPALERQVLEQRESLVDGAVAVANKGNNCSAEPKLQNISRGMISVRALPIVVSVRVMLCLFIGIPVKGRSEESRQARFLRSGTWSRMLRLAD